MKSATTSAVTREQPGPAGHGPSRLWRFWSARPTLAAALIYAVLAVVMVGQGLLPGRTLSSSDGLLSAVPWQSSRPANVPGLGTNFELADASVVFQPMLQYDRGRLPGIPLWNPYIMAGRPLLADGQSAVFSPFSVPAYVVPFWKSLAVIAMLKLFLGALGAFMFAGVLGMRFGGALLSGVVFAFGTFFVTWLAWPLTSVYAFIPWTLALTELLVRRPGLLPAAGLSAAVGLQFLGGHPESSFHLMFVTVVWFVFRLLLQRHRRSEAWRSLVSPVLTFVGALAVGGGLAALVLLPFLEFVLHSGDLARRAHTSAGYWPRKYIGALFLHDYWGRPTQVDVESFMQIRGWYAGAVTLMLAGAGLILKRTAERIAVLVFAAFCVCMVVGIPPVFGLVSALPGFSAAHNERLLVYVLLSLGLLAGWGLDDLSARRLPPRPERRTVMAFAGVVFCIPIAWLLLEGTFSLSEVGNGLKVAWGFVHPPVPALGANVPTSASAAIVRDSSLLIWLPLAAVGLILIVLRLREHGRLAAGAFVALTVGVLVVDLFRANMGYNPAIPIRNAVPPTNGAVRYLQSQRPNRFIGVSTLQLTQPLPSDLSMRLRLYDARGYDFPVEKRFDALWRRNVAPGVGDFTQPEEFAGDTPAALRALSLLSVKDLLVGPAEAAQAPVRGPGISVAYKGPDGVVYNNAKALPRVFVVDHQHTVAGEQAALETVSAPGFDGHGVAVTESPLPGLPEASRAAAPAGAAASFRSYGAERIVIDARASAPSLVVLTDDFYPGWTATVDGRSVPIQRVDYLLRGISIGPGRHTIVMRYQPASWTIGWIISVICLLGILGAVAVGMWQQRRTAAGGAAGRRPRKTAA